MIKNINEAVVYIENETGLRRENIGIDSFTNDFTDAICSKYQKLLQNALKQFFLYENLLTEFELDKLAIIRKNIDIEAYRDGMSEKMAEVNLLKLKETLEAITDLNNRIIKEVQRNTKRIISEEQ